MWILIKFSAFIKEFIIMSNINAKWAIIIVIQNFFRITQRNFTNKTGQTFPMENYCKTNIINNRFRFRFRCRFLFLELIELVYRLHWKKRRQIPFVQQNFFIILIIIVCISSVSFLSFRLFVTQIDCEI